MLNPSDGDRNIIGATITQLLKAIENINGLRNYGELTVTNLLSNKTSMPNKLNNIIYDQQNLDNDEYLMNEIEFSDIIILACGDIYNHVYTNNTKNLLLIQLKRIIDIADNNNKQIYCLDLNKNGTPRHPRFFSFKTILNHELIPYN